MASHIGRRKFLATLGGAVAAWPLAARAQQTAKVPTIGLVGGAIPSTQGVWIAAFVQRLRELGWLENRTSVIPIVFVGIGNPVGTGLVASLAHPGGNVSGLSAQMTDTAAKRLDTLREAVPALRRLAILVNVGNPLSVLEMREAQAAASALDVEAVILEIRRAEDIAPAFETSKGRADALYVASDPLLNSNRVRINSLALGARLPTMHGLREYVEAGGLMSYGANFPDLFRRAAEYVDKILRGAKPADLPVEQPTKFDLIVNLTTGRVLGLQIPEAFLLRADEVIE
jgi:ABC-type uncharacterized transport system substrate-binding protein